MQAKLKDARAGLSGKLELAESKLLELNDAVQVKLSGHITSLRSQMMPLPKPPETTAYDPALAYLSTVKLGVKVERDIGSLNCYSQEADADLGTISALLEVAAADRTKPARGHAGRWRRCLSRLRYKFERSR
jgi:hypothetical protein